MNGVYDELQGKLNSRIPTPTKMLKWNARASTIEKKRHQKKKRTVSCCGKTLSQVLGGANIKVTL